MRPEGCASPIPGLLPAPPCIPGTRPAGRGPEMGSLPPRVPPYSPASAPLTCRGVGDLPGSLPLRVRRSPRRGRAGGTCGPLGAWVSTPARPPRSLARWLAWRRAPTVLSARGGGQRSVPSGRRRDAPAQRGAAPCCCTDKRAALPPSRRGSGIWRSELRFTRVLCGKADAGPGAAEGARWSTAPKSLTPHREAPCWGREKAEARRRRRGGRGRRRRADKSEVNRKAP